MQFNILFSVQLLLFFFNVCINIHLPGAKDSGLRPMWIAEFIFVLLFQDTSQDSEPNSVLVQAVHQCAITYSNSGPLPSSS